MEVAQLGRAVRWMENVNYLAAATDYNESYVMACRATEPWLVWSHVIFVLVFRFAGRCAGCYVVSSAL